MPIPSLTITDFYLTYARKSSFSHDGAQIGAKILALNYDRADHRAGRRKRAAFQGQGGRSVKTDVGSRAALVARR